MVPVSGDRALSFGQPETLFRISVTTTSAQFEVSADGQRILVNELPPTEKNLIGARLIQNWVSMVEQ